VLQKYREPYVAQKPNVASFFGMIANLDENLDKLEQFLKTTGLRDDTILIFMTDNGGTYGVPVYNAGMKGAKQTLWEGGHRVPCFIRWPGGKFMPPADVGDLTEVQDILPTMVDLCGLTPPKTAHFDGTSLGGLLRGEAKSLADRMLVIHYSRMKGPAPTKDQAAVMWKRWRLLEYKELYDLTTDPGQQHNVIADHADIAAKMKAHLDEWWRDIEPRVNEHQSITIGSDAEHPTRLSPADWDDSFLDQGAQIRAGIHQNGAWNLRVERDGVYEFELRRWARETDAPMTAGLPPFKHEDGQFPAGVALPIARARLKVADTEKSADVSLVDKAVTFRVELKAGKTQLKTWFDDADGKPICGAYYVYVTRVN
jgi:arylsulfatase